jgi:hypothetical protein
MKVLLVFPPQWTPFSPPLTLPVLTGYLRHNGIETIQIDANVDFYNYILSKDFIRKVKSHVDTFMDRCNNMIGTEKNLDILPEESRIKYNVIKGIFKDLGPWWPDLETNTERAVAILKDPEKFFQPLCLAEAIYHLKYSLQACGLAYFPSDILLNYYSNFNYKLNTESLKLASEDKEGNIFLEYYEKKLINRITSEKPDIVGISINCNTQLIAGITLAKKLKSVLPHSHINIGGNLFTRTRDVIENNPGIFDNMLDTVILSEGELPLLKLVEAIRDKNNDYTNVPNLIYKKNSNIIVNKENEAENINNLPAPDFKGLDFTQYLSPETIFPVQSSRGCYWKGCSFCDHHHGFKYTVKTPQKLIAELKELTEKFNAKYFYFVDEAISPNYMKNMSKRIIEELPGISWYTCARAEEGFTKEVCDVAQKAGLKLILWGLESGSERVLKLINKGITKDTYLKILRNSSDVGVWNHAFVFFGFPSEELVETIETTNMLVENKDIIHSYGMGPFSLGKYSPIANNPDQFFIDYIAPTDQEFATATDNFTTTQGLTRDEVNNIVLYNTEYCAEMYGYPLWLSIGGYKDHIFLYLSKYGPKVLSYSPDEAVQAFGSF